MLPCGGLLGGKEESTPRRIPSILPPTSGLSWGPSSHLLTLSSAMPIGMRVAREKGRRYSRGQPSRALLSHTYFPLSTSLISSHLHRRPFLKHILARIKLKDRGKLISNPLLVLSISWIPLWSLMRTTVTEKTREPRLLDLESDHWNHLAYHYASFPSILSIY